MVRQPEGKYIAEWLQVFHPSAVQWRRVRLGDLPDHETARMYEVTLKWADAIYIENNTVHIVEAKLERQLSGLTQLELYSRQFRNTPRFSQYRDLPITLQLVVPYRDRDVEAMAAERGIDYIIYTPTWYTRF